MKKYKLLALSFLVLPLNAQEHLKLWYEQPAQQWVEALPLGNGQIGAMVFGGVENELIQLNEGTLWSGGPQKRNVNPGAYKYLAPIREALAKEDYEAASQLCRKMQGHYTESFLPLGDLHIKQSFNGSVSYARYLRSLQLDKAIATTQFDVNGVRYTREAFVTASDSVMVVQFTASRPGSLSLDISLTSLLQNTVLASEKDLLVMSGHTPARVDPNYYNKPGREAVEQIDKDGRTGMRFQTILKAIPVAGSIHTDKEGIHVKNADELTLLLSAKE